MESDIEMNQIFVSLESVQKTENTEKNTKVRVVEMDQISRPMYREKNCKSQTRIL